MPATRVRRKEAVLASALITVVALAATVPTGSSGQMSSSQTIKVYSLTLRGNEQPVHVVARGPISGIGTLTQSEPEARSGDLTHVTVRFDNGTVRLAIQPSAEGEGWRRVDRRTCTARRFGRGEFTITGGTGAYEGAAGTGTFDEGGVAIAQRTRSGKCLGEKTPLADVVFYVKLKMVGDATVPSS